MKYNEEQIESLLDRMSEFLDSYKQADDEFQTNQRRSAWHDKFGERLGKYSDKLKLLNGDDFDIEESSRKEYEDQYSDLTDDEYCNALENNIKATLQRIWPEATEEQVEQATEEIKDATEEPKEEEPKTEVHIEAEDKDGDGEIQKDEVETHTVKEEEPETEKEEEVVDDATDEFYKELEEAKNNMPKRD